MDDRQCRICLAGAEEEAVLGRLIKPCLCTGSIKYVHIRCLQRWRNSSATQSARFFNCPQCGYRYRFARTKVLGIATNPVVVGSLSALLFTALVIASSFITTFFMSYLEEPSSYYYSRSSFFSFSPFFVSPWDVFKDIVGAALRILQDEDGETFGHGSSADASAPHTEAAPGLVRALVRRFLLGLPIVGASSIVQMLLSLPVISPVHFLARYRSSRRREGSRDIATLIIVGLILIGAARALIKVYDMTQNITKRLLLRAEDAILEV
uniref:RING-CH-type domain-containing protein n=1 Tax=Mycena chlorophos TaxID=658473 RepID=A0ABQ0KYW1_MYCCL|nr:predicted protein [Mycena chlorophos]